MQHLVQQPTKVNAWSDNSYGHVSMSELLSLSCIVRGNNRREYFCVCNECVHIPRDRKLTCFEKSSAGTFNFYWRLVANVAPASLTLTSPGTWPALANDGLVTGHQISVKVRPE